METKDLFLLMLIPIILISIVVYTDKNMIATGAVVAQNYNNNMLGTYSISPSFKINVDYDFLEYAVISKELNKAVSNCKDYPDIGQCLKEQAFKNNWNCPEPQQDSNEEAILILYDFVNKFNECLNQQDKTVCRFSLDEREVYNRIYGIRLTGEDGEIKAELISGQTITGTVYINQESLSFISDYNTKDATDKSADAVNIAIKYTARKPNINEVSAEPSDKTSSVKLSKIFLLYKTKGKAKFIDESQEGSFRAPLPANNILDLPRIKGFRFCAKSQKQFYAYDKFDIQVKLRPIVYKFAVSYPNPLTPPPIMILTAEDKQKAQNSVVLKWGKAKWEDGSEVLDIEHYNIYCSPKQFEQDKTTKEVNLESLKPTLAISSKVNYENWAAEINKCGTENIQDDVSYYFAVTAVSKAKKEGKAVKQSVAISKDDLAPGIQKISLLNSDAAKEERLSSSCIALPLEKEGIPGNIIVGFYPPEKNEDDMTNAKINEPLTYYLHFSKNTQITGNLNECANSKKCEQLTFASRDDIKNSMEIIKRTFHKFRDIEDAPSDKFAEGQTYCFTIVAKDKKGNVIKSLPNKFVKPPQWDDLEKNPVSIGYFDDKGDIKYS
ncbi:MAG: hypothetical protein AABX33_07865 [Nanoarchaeota archaeon]